jgi:hypothetical protein
VKRVEPHVAIRTALTSDFSDDDDNERRKMREKYEV